MAQHMEVAKHSIQTSTEGFITPTFSIVLLLTITLIFSVAHIQWSMSVSAEIQEVADVAALSGAGVVANYRTVLSWWMQRCYHLG